MEHRYYLLLICCGSFLGLTAQSPAITDSSRTIKKNAIGAYITSPAVVLMGTFPKNLRVGLCYKRNTTDNRATRAQIVIDFFDVWHDDTSPATIWNLTDTTITYLYSSDKTTTTTFRGGVEWADRKKAISAIYGIDVVVGMGYYAYREKYMVYSQIHSYSGIYPDFGHPKAEQEIQNYIRKNYYAGIDFSLGCRANMGAQWTLIAQLSPELLFSVAQDVQYHIIPHPWVENSAFSMDFRLRLLELQLFYRF